MKYIMVQLPEPCGEKTEAYKAGYKNICEIGKERIRRAGNKIKEEIEEYNKNLKPGETPKVVPDIGFKVFKLDNSNIENWNDESSGKNEIVDGRTAKDVAYEILIKNGLELTERVYSIEIDGYTFHCIGEELSIILSLEENIPISLVEKMINPSLKKIIFSKKSFENSDIFSNVQKILNKKSIEMIFLGEYKK